MIEEDILPAVTRRGKGFRNFILAVYPLPSVTNLILSFGCG
jgi:hypothetical protein